MFIIELHITDTELDRTESRMIRLNHKEDVEYWIANDEGIRAMAEATLNASQLEDLPF